MTLSESLKIAETAHQQGHYLEAERAYKAILQRFKSNDATFGLATLYTQIKKYDLAITLFNQALQQEPFAIDITLNYAMCLKAANKNTEASQVIATISAHLPNDNYILNAFAHLALSIAQPTLALEITSKANKANQQTKVIIAKAHMQNENWIKALESWQSLSETSHNKADVQNNLAICLAKLRRYDEAITAFTAFLQLVKADSHHYLKFADLYILARDIDQARSQLNKAIALNDVSLTRYEIEIRVCRFEGNKAQALKAAEQALTINPYSYIAWGAKQEFANQDQQVTTQLAHLLTDTISNNYENQQNLFTLAKAYEKLAQYRLAFACFDKANMMQEQIISEQNLSYNFQQAKAHNLFLKQVFSTLQPDTSETPRNLFIVGMPRSGTTLMDRIFAQHPNIQSSGENEALALFIENKINAQQDKLATNWECFFQQHGQEFHRNYVEKTALNADIVVDKMPHNFRFVGAILAIFKQVKVIQMRRTPEDLALSIFSQPFAPHHNYAANLKTIAHAIYHANQLMDFWREKFPQQVIDVDYNQLTLEPSAQGQRIFKFCGLTWHDDYLNFHTKLANSFTFSELQVRQPINTKKQNFSRHYQQELADFKRYYAELAGDKY
ncbi:Tetratricopeptide repeat-containing protein [Colwellia chukchiensis]|uniref:Tetratricopeptide repeat-containing protein n=1 Tax=Colwellia chukchiensis TaxID=641665 RepID=A0A1H7GRI1_9GAMM|nr:tetratricopeptide repeat-containing sulfotransferase family protein [Colwellia chukchiensis]SEK38495.1 Tetratricopeptide repeat-containing protein [Colwellia chukchiensis]